MAMTLMDKEAESPENVEEGVEVEVEVNPNVEDQLEATASEEGIGETRLGGLC